MTIKEKAIKHYVENELKEKIEKVEINCETLYGVESENESYEFLVYTDEEADKATTEEIQELLWAFNPEWIVDFCDNYTTIQNKTVVIESIKNMQLQLCENANEIVKLIIGENNLDDFVCEAIEEDGRGHFLSPYNGEEIEIEFEGNVFYIYRYN